MITSSTKVQCAVLRNTCKVPLERRPRAQRLRPVASEDGDRLLIQQHPYLLLPFGTPARLLMNARSADGTPLKNLS